jgi:DNA-directed RNA polymerase specialized sigma24 family protein
MTVSNTLEELVVRRERLARELHGQFFGRLAFADCENAVQDAFIEISSDERCGALDAPTLERYVRTAARHNALDILKDPHHDGQGARTRTHVDIDLHRDVLADGEDQPDDEDQHLGYAEALASVWGRLPHDDLRIFRYRYLDDLSVDECARRMQLSRTKFERRFTHALERTRALMIALHPHDTCDETRFSIDLGRDGTLLPADFAAVRDAHLAGCPNCRAYHRRSRGLMAFAPLPVVLLTGRLAARVHALLQRVVAIKTPALVAGGAATVTATAGVALSHHEHGRVHAAHRPPAQVRRLAVPATTGGTSRSGAAAGRTSAVRRHRRSHLTARSDAHRAVTEFKPSGTELGRATRQTSSAPSEAVIRVRRPKQVLAPPPADSTSGEFAPQP